MNDQEISKFKWFKKYSHIAAWLSALTLLPILIWPIINHLFFKGEIIINEMGKIIVSYTNNGPSIRLRGTLSALDKDQFVKNISLVLIKRKDNSKHIFEWTYSVFHKNIYRGDNRLPSFSSTYETTYEQPYPFIITTRQPYRYLNDFDDKSFNDDIYPLLIQFKDSWNDKYNKINMKNKYRSAWKSKDQFNKEGKLLDDYYKEFTKTINYTDTDKLLDRNYYWEGGEYELEMKIYTSDNISFKKRWLFKISKEQSENIRHNISMILKDICLETESDYNSVDINYNKNNNY